ncbi:DUF5615 family PIN-like protein [candidate division CSSED10-310 bacterium]|uniref:DUF5615 family PIN-like protein n=1 Tax=candidate division CSSED10-310 bacterium TaxID=2855610 RepID=A0ABV6YYE7_UNCC1
MTGISYLLDENIPHAVRNQLLFHEPDLNVLCVGDQKAPPYGTPDEVILEWVEKNRYILVSRNRRTMPDHLKFHLSQGKHVPGIILLRRGLSLGQLIEDLRLIAHASEIGELRDQIIYLPL